MITEKLKKVLDWEPTISFKEGLGHTINWIKENNIELRTPFRGWPKQYRKGTKMNIENIKTCIYR